MMLHGRGVTHLIAVKLARAKDQGSGMRQGLAGLSPNHEKKGTDIMTYRHYALMLAAAGAAGIAAPALAQDKTGIEAGDVLLRVRGIAVAPTGGSEGGILPTLPGDRVSVSPSGNVEVDLTYMATDHIGFELIAATTNHSASGESGVTGGIGKIINTWVLPPTLTAQYHFNPKGKVRPYVGAGINYSVFWNENATDGLEAAIGPTAVHLDDSFGYAVQAGIDVDITPRFFLNLDVKFIDMDTTATLTKSALGRQDVKLHIDPVVVGVGVGLRL